jgi:Amt family ammonium transporter
MDAMDYQAYEFAQPGLLASLLVTQVPILLGLSLLETGAGQSRSRFQSILTRNVLVWLVAALAYGLIGFPIMYPGEGNPDLLLHWHTIFSSELPSEYGRPASAKEMLLADLMFQCSFCTLAALLAAASLPTKRAHWLALLFAFVFGIVIFPIFGSWHWGGGWLLKLGFSDFAGGTIVYGTAGFAALTIGFLFRRSHAVAPSEKSRSSSTTWLLGVAFLWFFPSALALFGGDNGTGEGWIYPPLQFAIDSAAVAGGLGALFASLVAYRRVDIPLACSGLLAGMASTSAGADIVPVQTLGLVACTAGALSVFVSKSLSRARVTDPVAAIAGFGLGGTIGTLVTGFYAGHPGLQFLGVAAHAVWVTLAVALFLGFLLRPGRSPES